MNEQQTPSNPGPPISPTQRSTGLDPKIAGLLAYFFGWLSGLIIYFIEKDNREVRFHALQSIAFNIVIFVAYVVLGIVMGIVSSILFSISVSIGFIVGSIISLVYVVLGIGTLVIWIRLMVKAYNEVHYKLPIIGDMVEKYV